MRIKLTHLIIVSLISSCLLILAISNANAAYTRSVMKRSNTTSASGFTKNTGKTTPTTTNNTTSASGYSMYKMNTKKVRIPRITPAPQISNENVGSELAPLHQGGGGGGGECGYSPDEKYLRMCKNPNSLQNKRIQFLKKYPLKEIFNIKKLEFIDGAFKILKRPSIQYEALEEEELLTSMRNIPITVHIVRRTNSTGGFSESDLKDAISDVNKFYNGFNMNFYLYSIRFIDSDNIFNTAFSSGAEGGGTMASYNVLDVTSRNAEQTLNIYFVPDADTSWAWRPNTDDRTQHILMQNSQATNGVTPSHEIGHWFDYCIPMV